MVYSQSANWNYDRDGDGLIEVSNLEQLNAIRYDLNGDGKADRDFDVEAYAAAFPATTEVACDKCHGYELTRSLDFDNAGSYASGAVNTAWTIGSGWLPIGFDDNPFDTTFEGNYHTINNLYIRRVSTLDNPGSVGLFGDTSVPSVISQIGLVNVDVTGYENVGGLAGMSSGSVIRSYVTGKVWDHGWHAVGGLIGYNRGPVTASYSAGDVSGRSSVGGLIGDNYGPVRNSYSTASVSGEYSRVGGLIGWGNGRTAIIASYATGDVEGGRLVGGLVGSGGQAVIASYASGDVSGQNEIGGLVGSYSRATIACYSTGNVSGGHPVGGFTSRKIGRARDSIWDTQSSGHGTGVAEGDPSGVQGKTTAELQSPTGYTGIYSKWNVDLDNDDLDFDLRTGGDDVWDFGTSRQYPVLKVDFDGDGVATWQEFGPQIGNRSAPTSAPVPTRTPTPIPTPAPIITDSNTGDLNYDRDGDGLIEVSNLEQLNAIRYDMDGNGRPDLSSDAEAYATAFLVAAKRVRCGNCRGYELTRPLDFDNSDSYASGTVATGGQPAVDGFPSVTAMSGSKRRLTATASRSAICISTAPTSWKTLVRSASSALRTVPASSVESGWSTSM